MVKKVTVGGAVKKDSKIKWDELLALPSTSKDTVFDHTTEQNAIFNAMASDL